MTDIGEERVAWCGHCGNHTPQKLVYTQEFGTGGWSTAPGGEIREYKDVFAAAHYVALCGTCKQLLVYADFESDVAELSFQEAELQWPGPPELHHAVPDMVAEIYEEATRIAKIAPNAYAVQIRRALEAICEDRHAKKGPLAERLQELAQRGEIPPKLAELTDVLRLLGNIGAHAPAPKIGQPDVLAMEDFFKAVVEYVYIAPAKLAEFSERLKFITGSRQ